MKIPGATPEAIHAFEALVPTDPAVTVRKVFGHPSAFAGGNMFFGVFGDGLFPRLGPTELGRLEKEPGARPFEPMPGRRMAGYVLLPPVWQREMGPARPWIQRGLAFAKSLPPKGAKVRKTRAKGG